jgi:adenylate cyclase
MRRWTRAWTIGPGTAVLGMLLAGTPVGLGLDERFGLGWLFLMRGPIAPPEEVVVVSLDAQSARRLGLPERVEDWPRTVHARLIERLVEAGASVIAFDVFFQDARDGAQDRIFADAIAAAGQVVLFDELRRQRGLVDGSGSMAAMFETERVVHPLPILAEAAAGHGPFPLPREPRRVDQFWTFVTTAEVPVPTLPMIALQRHAMATFPQWLELLREGGVAWIGERSEMPQGLRSGAELSRLMARLRGEFLEDPRLAERLRDRLGGSGWELRAKALLAALIDAYHSPDSRYLNFYGGAGRIRTVSSHQVLTADPASPPLDLAGRVVFVGLSEPLNVESPDKFMTVFGGSDGIDINGVEIAATAFANLLGRRTLTPAGPLPILLLVGAFGLAVGMTAASWPALVAIPASLALAALYYAGAQHAFSAHALWLPVAVPILIQLPLGLFGGLLAQYREARRARSNISRAMRYYLPEKVATGLAEAPLDPGKLTERVYAACMVTDAERFTSVAEDMSPEEVSGFLNEYFEILFGIVERHGGIVTDVVGDGMTSVWTAAQPEPGCRLRACLAALEIDRAVGEFNRRSDGRRLPTRIGLHAGQAMVGNVGGSGRFAYSVMGDSVNTAARIESLNKQLGTHLLATETMAGDLSEVVVRPLGRFQLVGKREALPMLEIVGRRGEACDQRLLAEFAAALGAFQRQDWARTGELLEQILLRSPWDGPSRFYLEECRGYARGAAPPVEPGLISLKRK